LNPSSGIIQVQAQQVAALVPAQQQQANKPKIIEIRPNPRKIQDFPGDQVLERQQLI
jgi:hypothetical protein